jgi:hypothetical protein
MKPPQEPLYGKPIDLPLVLGKNAARRIAGSRRLPDGTLLDPESSNDVKTG